YSHIFEFYKDKGSSFTQLAQKHGRLFDPFTQEVGLRRVAVLSKTCSRQNCGCACHTVSDPGTLLETAGLLQSENNAFQRILHLPVVNSACNSLQKTYATTKEAHPLVGSLCAAYERSLQSASSLAAWSVRPVVWKLEPHCK
uniref:Uncharacterized protein n=1 Tax=Anolis carolinensis TaxID=28377 RepID=A0A803SZA3_ANOCA